MEINMATEKQIAANQKNSLRSTGPSPEARTHTRYNGLKHGMYCRASSPPVLPGESQAAYDENIEAFAARMQPRDDAEQKLVIRTAHALWMAERAQRAQENRLAELIDRSGDQENIDTHNLMGRLFHDHRGNRCAYGVSSAADGMGQSSWSEKKEVNEYYDPYIITTKLSWTAAGCRAMIREWLELKNRVHENLGWQAPDRLKAVRLLGKHPWMAGEDRALARVYVACFAIHPFGRKDAYEDLKCEATSAREHKALVKRIRSRWPLVLDAGDTAKARQVLLDVFDENVARLEAKLKVHLECAEVHAERIASSVVSEASREGETLRRLEQAWFSRVYRSIHGYWSNRKKADEAREAEGERPLAEVVGENGTGAADAGAVAPSESHGEGGNEKRSNDANFETGNLEVDMKKEVVADGGNAKDANVRISSPLGSEKPVDPEQEIRKRALERFLREVIESRGPLSKPT
jgi:hypothetical protein